MKWKGVYERIVSNTMEASGIDKVYYEEKDYERLLAWAIKQEGLSALKLYEKALVQYNTALVLMKYEDEINKMVIHPYGRKYYREIVENLRSMLQLNGGKEVVNRLIANWRYSYSNRPAMMQELDKI